MLRIHRFIVAASIAFTLGCLTIMAGPQGDHAVGQDSDAEKIEQLQLERRDTLRARVDAVDQAFRTGRLSVDVMLNAHIDLIDAELEVVSDPAERIKLRTEALEDFRQIAKFEELKQQQGVGTVQEMLEAKAASLAAEIELLKERAAAEDE